MFKRMAVWLVIGILVAGHPGIALAGDDVMAPAAPGPVESSVTSLNGAATDPAVITPDVITPEEEWVALNNFIGNYVPSAEGPAPTDDQAIVPTADTNLPASTDEQSPVFAEGDQPTELDQAAISRLVRDIDSDSFRVRQAALATLQSALTGCRDDSAVATLLERIGRAVPQNPALEFVRRMQGLVSGVDIMVRRRIATDPGTSRTVLTFLARYDNDLVVRALITLRPDMRSAAAARNQAVEVLVGVANDPNTPPDVLSFLAQVPGQNVAVLAGIAFNRNAWPETLGELALAQNQNIDPLNANNGIDVLRNIIARPNTRSETLRFLVDNELIDISSAARAALRNRGEPFRPEEEPEQMEPQDPDQADGDSDQVEGSDQADEESDEESPPLVSDEGEQPDPLQAAISGLARDIDSTVRQAAISRLVRLVGDLGSSDYNVRQRASGILARALASPDASAVGALLAGIVTETQRNPAVVDLEFNRRLGVLVSGIDRTVVWRIATELGTSRAALAMLVQYHNDPAVRALATLHPNMRSANLSNDIEARNRAVQVLRGIASDQTTSSEDLGVIARVLVRNLEVLKALDLEVEEALRVVRLGLRVLSIMGLDGNAGKALPNLFGGEEPLDSTLEPVFLLMSNAKEQGVTALTEVVLNPNVGSEILGELAQRQDLLNYRVLVLIAGRLRTPMDLSLLAERMMRRDGDYQAGDYIEVLRAIAMNEAAWGETLRELTRWSGSDLGPYVVLNQNTRGDDLSFLAQRGNNGQRLTLLHIIAHSNVWLETLAELAGNENADVASAAQGQLTLRLLRLGGVI